MLLLLLNTGERHILPKDLPEEKPSQLHSKFCPSRSKQRESAKMDITRIFDSKQLEIIQMANKRLM